MKADEKSRLIVWVLLSNLGVMEDDKVASKSWGMVVMRACYRPQTIGRRIQVCIFITALKRALVVGGRGPKCDERHSWPQQLWA
jgi:hypothetical protein